MGTSRALLLNAPNLARLIDKPKNEVINLASLGADFTFMEMILRRNPKILQNAKIVIFDVMPMQVMKNNNYDERGEFFLRFASLEQRLNARGLVSATSSCRQSRTPKTPINGEPDSNVWE